jgi:demethylmenaquinone methyltransferase/2-methoxy-6-polyprenyl-1,4-benzoquinol methylase
MTDTNRVIQCLLTATPLREPLLRPVIESLQMPHLDLFAMLWGQPQPEVSAQDWSAYQRLCRPDSAACILDLPEYYAFFTYSVFEWVVA